MILLLNSIEWGTVAVVLQLSGTVDVKNCWWNEIYQLAWEYWSNTDMELHDAEEAIGMRKILAYDMRMKKNPQTKEGTFWIFMELCRSKVQLVPRTVIPSIEIVYMLLLFQIICIDWFFFFLRKKHLLW